MSHYDEQRESDIIWRNAPSTATHYGGGKYWRMHDSGNFWETEKEFQWVPSNELPLSFIDYRERPKVVTLGLGSAGGNMALFSGQEPKQHDPVNNPKHYAIAPSVEAIDIIKSSLTPEQFKGYLLGNFLKYRLRAGDKGDLQQDIDKSNWYRERLNTLREAGK